MSESIAFETVSTGNAETQSYEAFEQFVAWVSASYPEVHTNIELLKIADHTLLFKWQGKNSELQPILLTGHYDVVPVVPGTEDDWNYPPYSGKVADG
jgi:carboxypeptidase PM20D1